MQDPIAFAYERFGRHIRPGRPTGWLSRKGLLLKDAKTRKAGQRSAGMGGTSIYISDGQVLVFGPDYRDCGFPAFGDAGEAVPFFERKLLQPAREHWMMVMFSNTAVPLSSLHLNAPGDGMLRAYNGKSKGLVNVRHSVVADVANRLRAAGLKASAAVELLHLATEALSDVVDIPDTRRKKFEKGLDRCPDLPAMALKLARAEVAPHWVKTYFDRFLQEQDHV